MVLNEVQTQILEQFFKFIWQDWADTATAVTDDEDPILDGIEALINCVIAAAHAIEDGNEVPSEIIPPLYKNILVDSGVGDTVDQCLQILRHPSPQNRSTGSPYVAQDDGHVNWVIGTAADRQAVREPIGLLSLTARNVPEGVAGDLAKRGVWNVAYGDNACSRRDVARQIGLQLACAKNVILEHRRQLQREHQLAEEEGQRTLLAVASLQHEELVQQMGRRSRELDKKSTDYMRLKDAYYRVKQKLVDAAAESEKFRRENFQLRQQLDHVRKFGAGGGVIDGANADTGGVVTALGAGVVDLRMRSRTHSSHTGEEKQCLATEALAAMQAKSRRRKSMQNGEQPSRQRTSSTASSAGPSSLRSSPPTVPTGRSSPPALNNRTAANVEVLQAKVVLSCTSRSPLLHTLFFAPSSPPSIPSYPPLHSL
jgi:hypothetical protein